MELSSSASSKQGDNHGTRRNTRSTSNQDKDKENAENSKNGSSGNNTVKEQDNSNNDAPKKRQSERVVRAQNGDVLEYTTEDDVTYRPTDSAYLATERPDNPYFICTIQEIKVSKRDNAIVTVKWYYRPTEVPDLVYQMLVKDRYNQVDPDVKELIMKPDIVNRELFVADHETTDTYPISCLRGKCEVTHYNSISEIKTFELKPDHFFYIFSYNPEGRRLASLNGETRVGPSHQWNASTRGNFQKADLPELLSPSERGYERGREYEEMTWEPKVNECDMNVYLRAARSLAAFAGVYDGVSPEEGCIVAFRDDTIINLLRVLFENNGNPRKAIDALVKNPVPVTIESKWTEEQVKRFQKGLRLHGKNFFKIRKEQLPMKETGELVEFYYLWKKTQDNLMIRPHHTKHRRQATMKKSGKHKNNNAGSGDQTSTEEETEESEESEKEVKNNYKCKHCLTSSSKDWLLGGKDGVMLCTDCRIFFKKYGENRPIIKVEDIDSANETDIDTPPAAKSQVPPFLFKPIKEDKVNNLIPRKPAKSLAKVNAPTELKKPSKRQWSESEETKIKQEVLSTKLKRPKTETDQADDGSQTNKKETPRNAALMEMSNSDNDKDPVERKPFSPSHTCSLPPSIIPVKNPHPYVNGTAPDSLPKEIIPGDLPQEVVKEILSRKLKTMPNTHLVPQTNNLHVPSGKSSELEAISQLALNRDLMARTMYPTIAYVGAGTPPSIPSQMTTTGQSTSTYSLSRTTTVTTTNTVRPSPTVEPVSSNLARTSATTDGYRSQPREVSQPQDVNPSSHSTQRTAEHPSHNRLSPPPRLPTDKDKLGGYHVSKHPSTSTRSARFPFDPCVTDQIISNANMPRLSVKEEARPFSPQRHSDDHRATHHHLGPTRGSPHNIKQEMYSGIPNPQPGRPFGPGDHLPHHSHSGHHRPHMRSPHGSRPSGSTPRHPSHPSTPQHAAASRSRGPTSPRRMAYGAPNQGQSTSSQDRDDSDVEVISDTHPPTPVKILTNYGNSARFYRIWNRGNNSCFRTDFVFSPDKISVQKRNQRQQEFVKTEQSQVTSSANNDQPRQPPQKRPRTPSSHGHSHADQDRKRDDKHESVDWPRREGPGPLSSSSLQSQPQRTTSSHGNVPRTTPTRTPTTSYEQHHRPNPAAFVSTFGPDTPALRQLQHYASIDTRRNAATEAAMGSVPALYPYYPITAAENELRERELRERERLSKMVTNIKPDILDPHNANIQQLPPAVAAGLHMGAIPASIAGQHMATVEQQIQLRQYQAAHFLNSLPPGANPALALAAAANLPPGAVGPFAHDAYAAERLSAERLQAERLAAEQYQLDLLHHHSHSHVHSHLHLHPPGQPGGPPPPGTPLPLGALPPPPPNLAVADQVLNPYSAMQAINPFAASGNPLLHPVLRSQQAAAQAAIMQQGVPAAHLHAAAGVGRDQPTQPHPLSASQHLQAVHEQYIIESQQRARAVAALQEQQHFIAAARLAGHKP